MFMTFLWSCVFVNLTGVSFCLFPFLLVIIRHTEKTKKTNKKRGHYVVSHFLYLDHWDYHPHPHVHPVEFENLQETNFTELQSVQALHPPSLIRHEAIRYDAEPLLDPNLGAHPHVLQQPVSPSDTHQIWIFINILTDMQYINIDIMVCVVIKQCNLGVTGNGENITPSLYDLCALILVNCPITPLNPQILFRLTADVFKLSIIYNLV